MGDSDLMDHTYIESNGLVERYHQGLLPPDEEARFEEHFVECLACMEQLELARGFQKGLKTMVAEDAARAVVSAGLFAWLARRGRLAQWGAALAVLALAAALPALWLLAGGQGERQEWRARLDAQRRSNQELEHRLDESESRRSRGAARAGGEDRRRRSLRRRRAASPVRSSIRQSSSSPPCGATTASPPRSTSPAPGTPWRSRSTSATTPVSRPTARRSRRRAAGPSSGNRASSRTRSKP